VSKKFVTAGRGDATARVVSFFLLFIIYTIIIIIISAVLVFVFVNASSFFFFYNENSFLFATTDNTDPPFPSLSRPQPMGDTSRQART
jgi:hypothetical protein